MPGGAGSGRGEGAGGQRLPATTPKGVRFARQGLLQSLDINQQVQYARGLGVDPDAEPQLFKYVQDMLSIPLPPPWKECVDSKRRIFYFNSLTQASTWSHPLLQSHILLSSAFRRVASAPDKAAAACAELEAMRLKSEVELGNWREVKTAEGQSYYYHVITKETRWDNPRDHLMSELNTQAAMLTQLLKREEKALPLLPPSPSSDTQERVPSDIFNMSIAPPSTPSEADSLAIHSRKRGRRLRTRGSEHPDSNGTSPSAWSSSTFPQSPVAAGDSEDPKEQKDDESEGDEAEADPGSREAEKEEQVDVLGNLQEQYRAKSAATIQRAYRCIMAMRELKRRKALKKQREEELRLRRQAAAVSVQRHVRGHQTRAELRKAVLVIASVCRQRAAQLHLKQLANDEQERLRRAAEEAELARQQLANRRKASALKLQAWQRVRLAMCEADRRREKRALVHRRTVSCLKIQSLWRRSVALRVLRGLRHAKEAKKAALLLIQKQARMHLARAVLHSLAVAAAEEKAATMIQRVQRGKTARAEATRRRTLEALLRRKEAAARAAQRWIRGWKGRLRAGQLRREKLALTKAAILVSFEGLPGSQSLGIPGSGLGLRLQTGSNVVTGIDADGLVAAWNRACPEQALLIGDELISVNGKTQPYQMQQALEWSSFVDLEVRRKAAVLPSPLVKIDRSKGTSQGVLGRALGLQWNKDLTITSLDPSSTLAAWNQGHPKQAIEVGDMLLKVNGTSHLTDMEKTLRGPAVVQMVVFRKKAADKDSDAEGLPDLSEAESKVDTQDMGVQANDLIPPSSSGGEGSPKASQIPSRPERPPPSSAASTPVSSRKTPLPTSPAAAEVLPAAASEPPGEETGPKSPVSSSGKQSTPKPASQTWPKLEFTESDFDEETSAASPAAQQGGAAASDTSRELAEEAARKELHAARLAAENFISGLNSVSGFEQLVEAAKAERWATNIASLPDSPAASASVAPSASSWSAAQAPEEHLAPASMRRPPLPRQSSIPVSPSEPLFLRRCHPVLEEVQECHQEDPAVEPAPEPSAASPSVCTTPKRIEFIITLDKIYGEELGVEVSLEDGATMLIQSMRAGLIQSWNESNAHKQVQPGDRILEVNGVRGEVSRMVEEIRKGQVLKVTIQRQVDSTPYMVSLASQPKRRRGVARQSSGGLAAYAPSPARSGSAEALSSRQERGPGSKGSAAREGTGSSGDSRPKKPHRQRSARQDSGSDEGRLDDEQVRAISSRQAEMAAEIRRELLEQGRKGLYDAYSHIFDQLLVKTVSPPRRKPPEQTSPFPTSSLAGSSSMPALNYGTGTGARGLGPNHQVLAGRTQLQRAGAGVLQRH